MTEPHRTTRWASHALAFALAIAGACDHTTGTASAGSATSSQGSGKAMSGFATASSAFRAHAIKALGTSAVDSGPNNERVTMPHTIGGAWAFNAALSSDPGKMVRGWALADGTVITAEHNFGRLLEQAGLWATPRGDLAKLPAALAWSLGNAYRAAGEPAIKLDAAGAGTIAFDLTYQEAGGGGHISPEMPCDVVITVGVDRAATVKVTRRP